MRMFLVFLLSSVLCFAQTRTFTPTLRQNSSVPLTTIQVDGNFTGIANTANGAARSYFAGSQAAMLALSPPPLAGDLCWRSDISAVYIFLGGDPTSVSNWATWALNISSVFGRTGVITAQTGDYSVAQVTGAASSATLASSTGSALIGTLQNGAGAVLRTTQGKLSDFVSVFDYMTSAQIADVQAYSFGLDLSVPVQTAMDTAFANKKNLFIPAGGYKVTGLVIPGTTSTPYTHFQMLGEGVGNLFSRPMLAGTIFYSVTDAPILATATGTAPAATGTIDISGIRFEGSSTTPVVKLNLFYGQSEFHHNSIYQAGTGDGLYIGYSATSDIHHLYILNRDWLGTPSLGAARVGVGVNFPIAYDSGLTTFSKITSRGFKTGYAIGGGAGKALSTRLSQCESSYNYDGIKLLGGEKCVVDSNYLEGGDGGTGILNQGNYNVISNNLVYEGYAIGIDDSYSSNVHSVIENNTVNLGGTIAGAVGIYAAVNISLSTGGKTVNNNLLIYGNTGLSAVKGIWLTGNASRVTCTGNVFSPSTAWTGTGSAKIVNTIAGGPVGFMQTIDGALEYPTLSNGAISLGGRTLTEADVAANALTVPAGSYFTMTASVATTVASLIAGDNPPRLISIRTTNGNTTFSSTAQIEVSGTTPFTGPGIITFMVERIGALSYAFEVSRTVF